MVSTGRTKESSSCMVPPSAFKRNTRPTFLPRIINSRTISTKAVWRRAMPALRYAVAIRRGKFGRPESRCPSVMWLNRESIFSEGLSREASLKISSSISNSCVGFLCENLPTTARAVAPLSFACLTASRISSGLIGATSRPL